MHGVWLAGWRQQKGVLSITPMAMYIAEHERIEKYVTYSRKHLDAFHHIVRNKSSRPIVGDAMMPSCQA